MNFEYIVLLLLYLCLPVLGLSIILLGIYFYYQNQCSPELGIWVIAWGILLVVTLSAIIMRSILTSKRQLTKNLSLLTLLVAIPGTIIVNIWSLVGNILLYLDFYHCRSCKKNLDHYDAFKAYICLISIANILLLILLIWVFYRLGSKVVKKYKDWKNSKIPQNHESKDSARLELDQIITSQISN
ncbi:hypothetical protein SteCoe_24716 [Stentor coeruleus]|uniref:Uncharacterized protein n=1 Tax=Stentor coeruleus TaxID=5963 RepID=A0A1R2BGU8_9CILI|nr:hypothetical protein SteCoe_24716 [Stentor coeruleus]